MSGLTEQQKSIIYQAVADIYAALLKDDPSARIGLVDGLAGQQLFFWYLHKQCPELVNEAHFAKRLAVVEEQAALLSDDTSLCYGIAGSAWLFELLLAEQDEPYNPDFNNGVDQLLEALLSARNGQELLEYVLGLAGTCAYAVRRLKYERGDKLFERIIKVFEHRASVTASGATNWAMPALRTGSQTSAEPELNMGLAHGIPGIIAALIPVIGHPSFGARAATLVEGGCDWMVSQLQDAQHLGSYFGYVAEQRACSRLGWCYGDLANALILARAGHALQRNDFLELARTIGQHAAQRYHRDAMIYDAGICHGSAGLYLLFALLNRQLPDPVFRHAATYWLDDTLQRYQKHGVAGFDTYRKGEDDAEARYVPKTDFLGGYAGVGLCLLAAVGQQPDWVDALLLGNP